MHIVVHLLTPRLFGVLYLLFVPTLSDLIAKSLLTTVSLSTRDGLMSGGITDRVESGAIAPQTDNFAFTDDITKRVFLSGTVGTQEALVSE